MKPRVFVSSTYYDLKYIRNNLKKTIEQFGFESVLFENGNVTFEFNQNMDDSCYHELQSCQMMILVVGGRYGSAASEDKKDEVINEYERSYISITRKEFKTAKEANIPIFIFIDKNVYADYETYRENKNNFSESNERLNKKDFEKFISKFKFAHVDSINVFKFIDELVSCPICQFEKYDEVESYLINQWSGMFYKHLMDLKNDKKEREVLDSIDELKKLTELMNTIVDGIGKKVLEADYDNVQKSQSKIICEYFVKAFMDAIEIKQVPKNRIDNTSQVIDIIFNEYLDNDKLKDAYLREDYAIDDYLYNSGTIDDMLHLINVNCNEQLISLGYLIEFSSVKYLLLDYYKNIKPIIDRDIMNKELILKALIKQLDYEVFIF